jgi:hypothetical protein
MTGKENRSFRIGIKGAAISSLIWVPIFVLVNMATDVDINKGVALTAFVVVIATAAVIEGAFSTKETRSQVGNIDTHGVEDGSGNDDADDDDDE